MLSTDDLQYELMAFCVDALAKPSLLHNLYHYTSPSGMESILREQKLWFTRYDCLNDCSERKYIFDVFVSVCKKLKDNDQVSTDFYDGIVGIESDDDELLSYPDDAFHYGSFNCDYYICCFSKNPDSLPMWNYYAKGSKYEGYNISFTDLLIDYNKKKTNNTQTKIIEVIYDRKIQEQMIETAILRLCSLVKKQEDIPKIKSSLLFFLKEHAFAFKHECFKHEEEVRMVISIPKAGNEFFPIQYRLAQEILVPYIEYEFDKSAVQEITVGPLLNATIAKDVLSKYLLQNCFIANVKTSKIPIRY